MAIKRPILSFKTHCTLKGVTETVFLLSTTKSNRLPKEKTLRGL